MTVRPHSAEEVREVLDETFEAVVLSWEGTAEPGPAVSTADDAVAGAAGGTANAGTADARMLGERLEALSRRGVHVFVVSEMCADALDRRLGARPRGPGRLYLCTSGGEVIRRVQADGLESLPRPAAFPRERGARRVRALVGRAHAARFAAAVLATEGVTGRLVLVVGSRFGAHGGAPGIDAAMSVPELSRAVLVSVGPEPAGVPPGIVGLGGGPARLRQLLDAQLVRRAAGRVPGVDDDPRWIVTLPAGVADERVAESLGSLSNGAAGVRGTAERPGPASAPLFAVDGLYDDGERLLHGPIWTHLERSPDPARAHRMVDLRSGVLVREDHDAGFRSLRFVSVVHPHAMALRAEGLLGTIGAGSVLADPEGGDTRLRHRGSTTVASTGAAATRLAVAAHEQWREQDDRATVERLCAWSSARGEAGSERHAARYLARASSVGFDALLATHRRTWARRWRSAEVSIAGGADAAADELAARFALFHLLSAAAAGGEAAVGARGVTGESYEGHVFWDADVFVLPALLALQPGAARAMLEYRIRRLPAARAAARALGRAGARFPWESARDGSDVTPSLVHDLDGTAIPILTGTHEEHIVADVAWAASRYAEWSGDTAFLLGAGRDLVVETARYWASRIRQGPDGRGHLYGVMGPDEYHQVVDDNAYTNAMARWNLERGADLLERTAVSHEPDLHAEAASWRALAAGLVDGYVPAKGIYEQFAGYFALEPLVVADIARPPVAMDVVLGPERVSGSQLIKQADVLMIHHMLPEAARAGSLDRCLDFYEPRTAHGSSLSPAISATLLARAGRPDDALELFRIAARVDLDDVTGTSAGGLHLAAMGGVWQALAFGFLGVGLEAGALVVAPHLPAAWDELSVRLCVMGVRVVLRATHDTVAVDCSAPLRLVVAGTELAHEGHGIVEIALPSASPSPVEAKRSHA